MLCQLQRASEVNHKTCTVLILALRIQVRTGSVRRESEGCPERRGHVVDVGNRDVRQRARAGSAAATGELESVVLGGCRGKRDGAGRSAARHARWSGRCDSLPRLATVVSRWLFEVHARGDRAGSVRARNLMERRSLAC